MVYPRIWTSCRAALKIQPGHSEALNNLGRALAGQHQLNAAEKAYDGAVASDPANAAAHNNVGLLYMQLGRAVEAVAAFQAAISINSVFILALTNLATAYMRLGHMTKAEDACIRALAIDGDFAPALHSLGVIKSAGYRLDEAAEIFERILSVDPGHLHARINLASVLTSQGRHDAAERLFEEALDRDPRSAEAHLNLGLCLAERGGLDRADHCFRQAVKWDPGNVEAYYALATSGRGGFDDYDRANITALADKPGLSVDQRVKMHFALAALASADGAGADEFRFCLEGNRLRKEALAAAGQSYDADGHHRHVAEIADIFTGEFFDQRSNMGIESASPIFIVGMPRSGTTLVEQIIGAHAGVTGLGERDDIPKLIDDAAGLVGYKTGYPQYFDRLTRDQVDGLARHYLGGVAPLAGGTLPADKTPFNFLNLGVIALLFPNCRMAVRDCDIQR